MTFKVPFPSQPYKIDYPGLGNPEVDEKLRPFFSSIDQQFAELYKDLQLLTSQLNASPVLSGSSTGKSTSSALIGPPGLDGADGEDAPIIPGPIGARGPQGFQGATGEEGPPGEDGATGPTGSTGATGATGATGPTGAPGLPAIMGSLGDDAGFEDQIWMPPGSPAPVPGQITSTATGNLTDFIINLNTVVLMNNSTLATIQGIVAGFPGQLITFISIGTGQVDFTHQDSGEGTPSNRLINIVTSINTSLYPSKGIATYQYDASTLRWRLISHFQGGMIAYTPTWLGSVTNPAIGNGTLSGSYVVRGNQIFIIVNIVAGSTTTFGSGFWVVGTPNAVSPTGLSVTDSGVAIDVVGGNNWGLTVGYTGAVSGGMFMTIDSSNANVDATHPFAWANTDQLRIGLEIAIA